MATAQAVVGNLTVADREMLVAAVASSLSLVGSGFISPLLFTLKELRKFSVKLLFYLFLSDMFLSFFSIIWYPSKGYFCYAQGYTTHFFCVASFLWTTAITFTLHRTVVRTSGVMTVTRSIGNGHGHISRLGAWCWTQRTYRKGSSFYNILHTFVGCNSVSGSTYSQVIHMLNNAARWECQALNRWGYYPLILIGSCFFGTINRIHDFIEPGYKILWLSVLDVSMAALMGLFSSIAYGLNSSVRRPIYESLDLLPESFRRWFPKSLSLRSGVG